MKWQQSYVFWVGAACMALGAASVGVLGYDASLRVGNVLAAMPDAATGYTPLVASARSALQNLSALRAGYDRTVQLPVAPVVIPASGASQAEGFDANSSFQLTTIALGGAQRSAVINGTLVHPGDRLDSATVVAAIAADSVRIRRAGQTLTLTMHTGADDTAKQQGDSK